MFGLLFIVTWIEAMTRIEVAADWIRWWLYLDGSPIVGRGNRAAKMKKLLLGTVCVIALTAEAQAKPVQLASIDNRWVIEYDPELFAGACIATTNFNLLKLKLSFITAYPKEGTVACTRFG
jgi:hypothetical protein